ncbi:MAG: hypothetical protein JNL79_10045 [Myxococcales bacterium]|nr:hypothetical protein [Myxococcales bacterium]
MKPLVLASFVSVVGLALSAVPACSGSSATTDGPVDTGTLDTGAPDTTPADTGDKDTGLADTGTVDTGTADADAPIPWPTCDAKPATATTSTLPEIWKANPTTPVFTWVSGAIVTGVSQGGCSAGKACQIFLQDGSFASLAASSGHAIRFFASIVTGERFAGIAVGDKVDVAAYAVRYTLGGQNELLLEVNDLLRGCMKKTGTGTIDPVAATLAELGTVDAYENKYGPVLVKAVELSGKPDVSLGMTFGLFTIGVDAGGAPNVSLSPYFLPGAAFTAPLVPSTKIDFTSVTGVFGMFVVSATGDAGTATKYLQIYPRTMADLVKK